MYALVGCICSSKVVVSGRLFLLILDDGFRNWSDGVSSIGVNISERFLLFDELVWLSWSGVIRESSGIREVVLSSGGSSGFSGGGIAGGSFRCSGVSVVH